MFTIKPSMWSFHVVILQRVTKECAKVYNARAKPVFCLSKLLFSVVLVAVIAVTAEGPYLEVYFGQATASSYK